MLYQLSYPREAFILAKSCAWQLGPGRWLVRLNWSDGWSCGLLDVKRYQGYLDSGGDFVSPGLTRVGDNECKAAERRAK